MTTGAPWLLSTKHLHDTHTCTCTRLDRHPAAHAWQTISTTAIHSIPHPAAFIHTLLRMRKLLSLPLVAPTQTSPAHDQHKPTNTQHQTTVQTQKRTLQDIQVSLLLLLPALNSTEATSMWWLLPQCVCAGGRIRACVFVHI